jgi:hypothetical protein
MNTPLHSLDSLPAPQRNRLFGGIFLIGLGLLIFLGQFLPEKWMGVAILPVLGAGFLLWGLLARNAGLLVPGGILSGIALGTYLITGPYADATDEFHGGVFLLAFAAGWALITVLSFFVGCRQWWPLIPGGILALIGAALLGGGVWLTVLELAGKAWPLALIVIGITLLVRRK